MDLSKHLQTLNCKSYTILIVEENELNLRMLSLRLRKYDFNIVEQADGLYLTETLINSAADLILMNMNLPRFPGWDLVRALKSNPLTRSVPLIAVTANAMTGDAERTRLAGCDDYISKPIDFCRLLEMISHHLNPPRLHARSWPDAQARLSN